MCSTLAFAIRYPVPVGIIVGGHSAAILAAVHRRYTHRKEMEEIVNRMTMIGANRNKCLDAAEESMMGLERSVDKLGEAIIRLL